MEIAEERRRMRRRRRKEVAPAMLLLLAVLVACELPLHTAAAPVAAVGRQPDVGSDHIIVNTNPETWSYDYVGHGPVIPGFMIRRMERTIRWMPRIIRGEYNWFRKMWRIVLESHWQRVDGAETYVVTAADPRRHFDNYQHFRGFAHFLLDLVRYPGKWRRPANDDSPLGRCFTLSFPPCLRKHGQVAANGTVLFCVLHFLYECNYDKAVHVPGTNSFSDYTTPPGRHLPLPEGRVPVATDDAASAIDSTKLAPTSPFFSP